MHLACLLVAMTIMGAVLVVPEGATATVTATVRSKQWHCTEAEDRALLATKRSRNPSNNSLSMGFLHVVYGSYTNKEQLLSSSCLKAAFGHDVNVTVVTINDLPCEHPMQHPTSHNKAGACLLATTATGRRTTAVMPPCVNCAMSCTCSTRRAKCDVQAGVDL